MQTLPEFFQGSVAQDFQGILDADPPPEAAPGELACEAKKPPKTCAPACKNPPPTPGIGCTDKVRCEGKKPTTCAPPCKIPPPTPGIGCTDKRACIKKKAVAFLPGVPGWSSPPAPPAF